MPTRFTNQRINSLDKDSSILLSSKGQRPYETSHSPNPALLATHPFLMTSLMEQSKDPSHSVQKLTNPLILHEQPGTQVSKSTNKDCTNETLKHSKIAQPNPSLHDQIPVSHTYESPQLTVPQFYKIINPTALHPSMGVYSLNTSRCLFQLVHLSKNIYETSVNPNSVAHFQE